MYLLLQCHKSKDKAANFAGSNVKRLHFSTRQSDDSHVILQNKEFFPGATFVRMVFQTQFSEGCVDFRIGGAGRDPKVAEGIFYCFIFG